MKMINWSLALLTIAAALTSCGQPKSNRNKITSDIDPQAAVLIQQNSTATTVESLQATNSLFNESTLDNSDQGLVLLALMNEGASFKGNIYYGTRSNPVKGEQMNLSFDKRSGSSYIYVNIMSSRRNTYTGVQPNNQSPLVVSYFQIELHQNTSCLIVKDQLGSYEAVVCK